MTGGGTSVLTFTPAQPFFAGEVLSVSLPPTLVSAGGTAVTRHVYQFTAATGGGGRGFFGDTTHVGYTSNREQVLGDLDNDGDLDLVTTGGLYGCFIYLNNGTGQYLFHTGVIVAQTTGGVVLGDVDNDGDLDLLASDAASNTVAVCINDGLANFIGSVTGAQNAPVGVRPVSVAAGDVDGDGDLDFVTANAGGNSATVRFNSGSLPLLYTTSATVAVGTGPTSVALADIDNDGDLDLLTTNAGTTTAPLGTVSVSRNTGTGSFGAATSVAVGLQPSELALADVDGDGDLDVLTANAGGTSVSLRLNNGSGTFAGTATLALPTGSAPTGLRTGDVDADGDLDVVVAQGAGGRVFTYLNTAGTFTVQARPLRLSRPPSGPTAAVGVTLGDVDADGDLDLITSDSYGNVVLGTNVGTAPPLPVPTITSLTPSYGPIGTSVTVAGTALADITGVFFNGMPAPGFILNGSSTSLVAVVPAGTTTGLVTVTTEEAGTATSPGPFTVTLPVPVRLTSMTPTRNALNAPPNTNVTATFSAAITAATAGDVRVFSNQRLGRRPGTLTGGSSTTLTFDPTQDFAPGERVSVSLPASLRAADGNQVSKQVVQFTVATGGSGQLDFSTATTLTVPNPGEPVLGDIDHDGDLDFLTHDRYTGTVSIRLNNGTGTFTNAPDLVTAAFGLHGLVLGDVDGDSDLDLIALESSGNVSVWLNNGSGTFSSGSVISPTTNQVQQAVLADVDADADLDLLIVTDQQILVRLNNGAGAFTGTYSFFAGTATYSLYPTSLTLGDVDADGDLDAVVSGFNSYSNVYAVSVQPNDGAGQFSAGQGTVLPSAPGRVALGDLDRDGDLDVVVQNASNSIPRISIRMNDGAGAFSGTGELYLSGAGPVLADADADGDLDIITHNGVGLNNGRGGFAAILPILNYSSYPGGIAVGDLDGDLDLDLLTAQENNLVTVRLNQPAPAPTITSIAPGSGPVGITVVLTGNNLIGTRGVAFNGLAAPGFAVNSRTELVVTVPTGATTGPITVTTPTGTATSMPFVVTLPIAVLSMTPARHAPSAPRTTPIAVTFAQPISSASAGNVQVQGSRLRGKRAGIVTGGGTSTLTFTPTQAFAPGEAVSVSLPTSLAGTSTGNVLRHVYQFTAATGGTGTGLFTSTGTADASIFSWALDVAVGDLDNDGDLDFVTSDGSARLNNGTGTFSNNPTNINHGGYPTRLALADLDGNGTLDVLSSAGGVNLNAGNATFTQLPNFAYPGLNARDMAVGDLDGDGDIDLAYPTYNSDSLFIRFNNGSGSFPRQQRLAIGNRPVGVAAGDIDNDGDLDLLVVSEGTNSSTNLLYTCLNDGNGFFTRASQLGVGLTTATSSRVTLGDLDSDGDLDLVTNAGVVRLNDGTGAFTGTQTTASGVTLALGDVDADGDLDLMLAGYGTAALRLNNGQGQFSPAPVGVNFGSSTSYGLALADVDGDGDLDALATNSSSGIVHVRLNHRVAPPIITGFTPASGLVGAGVVITGTDLIGTTAVAFNGTPAPGFIQNSATQITVNVPAGATSGPISVTNPSGSGTSAATFTVLQPVAVASVSPTPNAVAALSASITATFGQTIPINAAANLAVFSEKRGGLLAGARTGAGSSTLTLTPTHPFRPGERVSVSIPPYTNANQTRVLKQVYQFRAAVGGTGRGYLTAASTGPMSTDMADMVLGDVDNDGDEDMVVHHVTSVEVRLNNGTGSFSSAGSVAVTTSTVPSMVLGDVDGDGDLDLATSGIAVNSTGNDVVSIRLNNGVGTFSGTMDVPVGDRPRSIAFADMDADGDLDLVTANQGRGSQGSTTCTIGVRFNDGAGNFSGTTNAFLSNGTNTNFSNIEIGDVDGDGDLDVLVGNALSIYIMLNDGLGRLNAATATISTTLGAYGLALGDLDADGDLDLLAMCGSNVQGTASLIKVCLNNGTGSFTGSQFPLPNLGGVMTVGDMDADSDLDIIVTYHGNDPSDLWLNNGNGTFTRLMMTLDLGYAPATLQLSDVDNDGDLDVVSGNQFTATTYSVRLNGPTPPPVVTSFTPATGPEGTVVVVTGSGFLGTTAVSFNGTSAPGFIINSPTQITVRVPVGASTGPISVTTAVATGASAAAFTVIPLVAVTSLMPGRNATAAAPNATVSVTFAAPITAATAGNMRVFGNMLRGRRAGTLTGGGTATLSFTPSRNFAPGEQISVTLPPALLTTTGGLVRREVYQFRAATGGTGRATFWNTNDIAVGRYAFALATGDIDNDGDLDVLTSSTVNGNPNGNPTVGVLLNNGQAQFTAGTAIDPGSAGIIYQMTLGDVDGDGDLDLVSGLGDYGLRICRNNGNGTFAPAQLLYGAANRFALGDMDADGDLDIVASSYTAGAVSVLQNNGTGSFASTPLGTVASPTVQNLTLGDVDNDGDLDVVTNNNTNGVRFLLNDGTGALGSGAVLAVPGAPAFLGVTLGDVDGDGDLDLATAYNDATYNGWLNIFTNNGNGVYTSNNQPVASGRDVKEILFGDMDHDGDLDLIGVNGSSDDVSIRLNNGSGTFVSAPSAPNIPVHSNPTALALGDLDGDGDLDFAVTQATTGTTYADIRLNEGRVLANMPARPATAAVMLYPNPTHGQFAVMVPAELRPNFVRTPLRLYNSVGQLVLEQFWQPSASSEILVDATRLPTGIYTLRLELNHGLASYKLILH